ncbi:hypothetical protein [Cryobacterium sp. PH31-O1]|uniref:hypothetical protein n=1 Tax=Cryobacterium sp. PH31-O1 TaxID=3046306 RepID=UPI0024B8952B|nr:hypothetical protein [Cryobacterium sp. PH31-O1]MDJ0337624.1 hypothetical protein [Cryobacterium sp. PH31-O1]
MTYVVNGTRGIGPDAEATVVILSEEWDATIPLTPNQARILARKLIEAAQQIEQPHVTDEWP